MGVVEIADRAASAPPAGTTGTVADDSTRQRICQLLLSKGSLTTAELAAQLCLTTAGVRRQLANLTREGIIISHESSGERGRGRPARSHRLTPAGRAGFGDAYDTLALSALAELVNLAGPDAVDKIAEQRLQEVEQDYLRRREADPDTGALQHLADALSAAGYFASTSADDELHQHHCPVAHVAARYPQLCEAETGIFARLLGTDVSRSATIAHGDLACRIHLGGSAADSDQTGHTMLPDPVPATADRKVNR